MGDIPGVPRREIEEDLGLLFGPSFCVDVKVHIATLEALYLAYPEYLRFEIFKKPDMYAGYAQAEWRLQGVRLETDKEYNNRTKTLRRAWNRKVETIKKNMETYKKLIEKINLLLEQLPK